VLSKRKRPSRHLPLSLNALVAGCNQKNNRDPVLAASESEVQRALDELRRYSLVIESERRPCHPVRT